MSTGDSKPLEQPPPQANVLASPARDFSALYRAELQCREQLQAEHVQLKAAHDRILRLLNETLAAKEEVERLREELEAGRLQNLSFAADLAKSFAHERQAHSSLAKSQEQLTRSAKLATLGQMVAAIAHDVGNMISPIGGYAELLAMDPALSPACKRYTGHIREAVSTVTSMLRGLTNYGSKGVHNRSDLDVPTVVKAALSFLEYNLTSHGVKILIDIGTGLPPVYADSTQLEQVLVNLILNAQHAMEPAGGELRISAHAENGSVRIKVSDQGHGIAPEIKDRIFEPYFTTKEHGKGTGMGLFMCHQIIEQHGGAIDVQSEQDRGTTFSFTLPVKSGGPSGLNP